MLDHGASRLGGGVMVINSLGPLFIFLLFFLPTIISLGRDHPHYGRISVINLFAGVTGIGWLVAMGMALFWRPAKEPAAQPKWAGEPAAASAPALAVMPQPPVR